MRRVLLTIGAGLDWFLATHLDRHVCEWANLTNGDDE